MAFRIHDSVVRGEIDNRVKGVVRGQIWVEGRGKPRKELFEIREGILRLMDEFRGRK